MKNPIDSLCNGLVAQRDEIDRDLATAKERVAALKKSRRKVANAIKALDDSAKPAPKQAQVQQAIEELLVENDGAIAADDLEALVAEELDVKLGCSAVGLALRLGEVLSNDKFVTIDGKVRRSPASRAMTANCS